MSKTQPEKAPLDPGPRRSPDSNPLWELKGSGPAPAGPSLPRQVLPTFQVAALRLRVRPRLLRVLFMRKEKHRSVGASGFFLDRPEEGRRVGGRGRGRGRRGREGAGEGGAGHRVAQDRAQVPPAPRLLNSYQPHPQNLDLKPERVSQGYVTLFKTRPPPERAESLHSPRAGPQRPSFPIFFSQWTGKLGVPQSMG